MKISVVIPVFNAERTLARCLAHLAEQSYDDYEVILVDNNSRDASADILEEFVASRRDQRFRVVQESRQGVCFTRNHGASLAAGEIVVFADPDCLASPEWLTELASCFEDPAIAAVAGNMASAPPENIYEKFSALFTLPGRTTDRVHDKFDLVSGGYPSANLAFRIGVYRELGGFDESITIFGGVNGEDHDLVARLYLAGYRLLASSRATVAHWHRSSLRGVLRQGFMYGLTHPRMLRDYGEPGTLVEAGPLRFRVPSPFKGWITWNTADKRLAVLAVVGAVFGGIWGLLLPAGYFVAMLLRIRARGRRLHHPVSIAESVPLGLLLVGKSAAMTWARVRGSFIFGVLCF